MWLPIGMVSFGDVLLVCFRVVNCVVFAFEGLFCGFSHAFGVKMLSNILVDVALSLVSVCKFEFS